jgi:hypothetical protein
MSKENVDLVRRGYEAVTRGDLDALSDLLSPDLKWNWWEPGPWDCRSRDEALEVIRGRLSQNAIGELNEVSEIDDERVLVVTTLPEKSEIVPTDLGLPEGRREVANVVTDPGRQGGGHAGLQEQGRGSRRGVNARRDGPHRGRPLPCGVRKLGWPSKPGDLQRDRIYAPHTRHALGAMLAYDLALDALPRPLVARFDLGLLAIVVLARDRRSKLANPPAHGATELGQALRTEDDQGDDGNDNHLERSDVWHRNLLWLRALAAARRFDLATL